jgi:DNA-binding transcriptional MerR regulator
VTQYNDLLIDALLDQGFSLAEAERLIQWREQLDQRRVYRERQRRFAKWLVMTGRLNEYSCE